MHSIIIWRHGYIVAPMPAEFDFPPILIKYGNGGVTERFQFSYKTLFPDLFRWVRIDQSHDTQCTCHHLRSTYTTNITMFSPTNPTCAQVQISNYKSPGREYFQYLKILTLFKALLLISGSTTMSVKTRANTMVNFLSRVLRLITSVT